MKKVLAIVMAVILFVSSNIAVFAADDYGNGFWEDYNVEDDTDTDTDTEYDIGDDAEDDADTVPYMPQPTIIRIFAPLSYGVQFQSFELGTVASPADLFLPMTLSGQDIFGDPVIITVAEWVSNMPFNPFAPGVFIFSPSFPDNYIIPEDVQFPVITVEILQRVETNAQLFNFAGIMPQPAWQAVANMQASAAMPPGPGSPPDFVYGISAETFYRLFNRKPQNATDGPSPMGTVAVFGGTRQIYVHAGAHTLVQHPGYTWSYEDPTYQVRRHRSLRDGTGFESHNPPASGAYIFTGLGSRVNSYRGTVPGTPHYGDYERGALLGNVMWRHNSDITASQPTMIFVAATELNLNNPTGNSAGKRNFIAELHLYYYTARGIYAELRIYFASGTQVQHVTTYDLGEVVRATLGAFWCHSEFYALFDIAAGDLNGDGIDDIALRFRFDEVRVFTGREGGIGMPYKDIPLGTDTPFSSKFERKIPDVSLDISDLSDSRAGDILTIAVGQPIYRPGQNKNIYIVDVTGGNSSIRFYRHTGTGNDVSLENIYTHYIAKNNTAPRPVALNVTSMRADGRTFLVAAGYCFVTPGKPDFSDNVSYYVFLMRPTENPAKPKFTVSDRNTAPNDVHPHLRSRVTAGGGAINTHIPRIGMASAAMDGAGNNDTIMIAGYFYQLDTRAMRLTQTNRQLGIQNATYASRRYSLPIAQYRFEQVRTYMNSMWLVDVRAAAIYKDAQDTGREHMLALVGGVVDNLPYTNEIPMGMRGSPAFTYRISIAEVRGDNFYTFNEGVLTNAQRKTGDERVFATLALPDVTPNGILMRYVRNERVYLEPRITAVLQSAPFFDELTYTGGSTTFTNTTTKEQVFTVGGYVGGGWYMSAKAGVVVKGQFARDVTVQVNYEFARSWVKGYGKNHTAYAGDDYAIVSVTPITLFHYEFFDTTEQQWLPSFAHFPMEPLQVVLPVAEYDEIAALYDTLQPIRGRILHNTPGVPETYNIPPTVSDWTTHPEGTQTVTYGNTLTSLSHTISSSDRHSASLSASLNIRIGAGAEVEGNEVMTGGILVFGVHGGYSWINSEGNIYEGAVFNLPVDAKGFGYGFCWDFGWGITDCDVIVLGFTTENVSRPPYRPRDLRVTNYTDSSVSLAWEGRPGGDYFVYMRRGNDWLKVNPDSPVQDPANGFEFTVTGLAPNQRFYFRVERHKDGLRSMPSHEVSAQTRSYGNIVITQHPQSVTVPEGQIVTFTAAATLQGAPAGFDFQWQRMIPGGVWTDIPGATSPALGIVAALSATGHQFRARIRLLPYDDVFTNPAVLTVTATPYSPGWTYEPTHTSAPASAPVTAAPQATGDTIPAGFMDVPITKDSVTGIVTIVLDRETKDDLIAGAKAMATDGERPVVSFDLRGVEGATAAALTAEAIHVFEEAGVAVKVKLPAGKITLAPALASIVEITDSDETPIIIYASNVAEYELGDRRAAVTRELGSVVRVLVLVDDEKINLPLTVSLPFDGEHAYGVIAWYVCINGYKTDKNGTFNPYTEMITFTIEHHGYFLAGHHPVTEEQVPPQTLRLVIGDATFIHNGLPAQSDAAPFIDPIYNRTMVPVRLIAEAFGAQVGWVEETRTVTIMRDGQFISLQIGEPLPDGMGVPVIVNDRTFVPIAHIGRMLGADVRWDEVNRVVYIQR